MKKSLTKVVLTIHPDFIDDEENLRLYVESCRGFVEHRPRTFFGPTCDQQINDELDLFGGFRHYLWFEDAREALYAKIKWGGRNDNTL